jgi:hypothetical protein
MVYNKKNAKYGRFQGNAETTLAKIITAFWIKQVN